MTSLQPFNAKAFADNELRHSGCSRQSPVDSGCRGTRPGQNRDNFSQAGLSLTEGDGYFYLFWITTAVLMAFAASATSDQPNRQLTREETEVEIKKLWDEYVSVLPRSQARQTGAIYARYSTKFQSSIIDQVRALLEFAARDGVYIPLENICYDLAVSGRKKNRPGLQKVEQTLESKSVNTLLVFTTNRLHRRANRALEQIEKLVKEQKKRVVFVMNQVDSEKDERWKQFLQFLCLFDEFASEMYVESIRASHIGKLINRMVFGTLSFGYHGVDIPGSSNRKGKPNRRIEIHKGTAKVVKQVFDWFAKQGMSIKEIIRRLNNDPDVPPPPKSKSGRWTRLGVKTLLKNARYIGQWSYGAKESILIADKDYIRQDERDEPLKTVHFEELRIICDELFYKAQQCLQELDESADRGRKPAGQNQDRLPKVLNGFFFCPEHDQRLHVGGPRGEYMICPVCHDQKSDDRFLFSQLNREIALKKICATLAKLVREDTGLVEQIINSCRQYAAALQKPDENRLNDLKTRQHKLKRSVGFLVRQEPDSEAEEQEMESALREKRIQLSQLEAEIARLISAEKREVVIPEAVEVRKLLDELGETLNKIVEKGIPEEHDQLRVLLRRLTGGRIELYQQGERKARKGWLQGRFKAPLVSSLSNDASGAEIRQQDDGIEVVIDFKAPDRDEELMERAWELYWQDKLNKDIARELGCGRGNVTRLLGKAADQHGVELEDGRKRRARLKAKQTEPPQYQLLSEESKKLSDEDNKSFTEIGRILNCSDTTAKKAYEYWYESRELAVPTPESRREELKTKARQLRDERWSDAAIGRQLGVSGTTVRNWLD